MLRAAKAWRLREVARQALGAGEFERALELVSEAQEVERTRRGEDLRLLGVWLRK